MSKNSPVGTAKQKQAMLHALEANYGNIKKAAKAIGISTQTHFRWVKEDGNYEKEAKSIRDLGYRGIKDDLIEIAMKKAENGDSAILSKMLGIFLKDLPEEMARLNRFNDAPLRVGIKYIDNPRNQPGYVRPE